MADDINKKINIDIEINTDGQQQLQQYKAAFDSLRSTINNLNNPLTDVSKSVGLLDKNITNLSGSISKLSSNGSSFVSTIYKIGGALSNSLGNFSGMLSIIDKLGIEIGTFEAELTGGISLLISFVPVIVDWVSSLFDADTAVKSLTQALSDQKLAFQAVNQARHQGDQNAQQELVHLKLLYSALQDQNLSLTERKKAVTNLQNQYPGYFGNLYKLFALIFQRA